MSSTTRLSLNQIAVLSALMVEARELTNAELAELAGAPLTGADRKRLVTGGLIEERRVGRTYAFQLSAAGWSSCVDMLAAQARGKGSAASTVGTLLTGLSRALTARGADARSFFGAAANGHAHTNGGAPTDAGGGEAATKPVDVEERIRMAYQKLATEPAGWVSLADLRDLLDDIPRPEQDAALKRVAVQAGVRLIPVANLKSLTSRDRAAAVRFGGEDNHALAIEAA